MAAGSLVAAAGSLIVRLRRAGSEQRQQIKWLAYGGAVVVGAIFVGGLISLWSAPVSIGVMSVAILGLPILTGVAIVKHRLYDIDVLINRTLVYGTLSVCWEACTLAAWCRPRRSSAPHRPERLPQLAIVASTLAIAALFDPLRRGVQAFIDRRFYRRKYDARETLEAFSSRLRNETDLDALNADLLEVVRETMQPAHVSIWLRPEPTSK